MNKRMLLIGSSTLAIAVSIVGYYYFNLTQKASPRELTCLSAVIPSVVLHYEQEQIVQLLHSLASEDKESAPELVKDESIKPLFSKRIDDELLRIAEYFKMKGNQAYLEEADVVGSVNQAVSFFQTDSPKFLQGCLAKLDQAELDCGSIENPTDSEKICLEKHSDKINKWVQTFFN